MDKGGYKNDCAAEWLYTKALLVFVKEGDSENAREKLKIGFDRNKYVSDYLIGRKPMPRYLPNTITMGGEDAEAGRNLRNAAGFKVASFR